LIVVAYFSFVFPLVFTLVLSFPFPTQVDCYFEQLIVIPPVVLVVAAESTTGKCTSKMF